MRLSMISPTVMPACLACSERLPGSRRDILAIIDPDLQPRRRLPPIGDVALGLIIDAQAMRTALLVIGQVYFRKKVGGAVRLELMKPEQEAS